MDTYNIASISKYGESYFRRQHHQRLTYKAGHTKKISKNNHGSRKSILFKKRACNYSYDYANKFVSFPYYHSFIVLSISDIPRILSISLVRLSNTSRNIKCISYRAQRKNQRRR